jgi:hypothetical protein
MSENETKKIRWIALSIIMIAAILFTSPIAKRE